MYKLSFACIILNIYMYIVAVDCALSESILKLVKIIFKRRNILARRSTASQHKDSV